ncbi:hypothetical protein RJ639_010148 [Escallonia herrerae]|uniref:FLZ-type domain-containing protein n=1 Tax=Escallonia herrerae TaxID=1293975 RepID=A0AA88VUQ5_9ASTE|nr:hypothetical protein RJ639_010148 [Escallonia herrerae]
MPAKRCRLPRPSRPGGNTELFKPLPVPRRCKVHATPPSPTDEPRPMFFTAFSSVDETNEDVDGGWFRGFLERCYNCNQRILSDQTVFMYRDFHAFCTPECRAIQIKLDEEKDKIKNLKD